MRFSVLPDYHAVEYLLKVLLPCGGRAFYVLVDLHCEVSLIFLILLPRITKIKERKMDYIIFFEKKQNYFFQYSVQHYIALIECSHRHGSGWSL